MSNVEIIINQIYGTPPFFIYICDVSGTPCYQVPPLTGIGPVPPPFSFFVPPELSGSTDYKIKIIDSNSCETQQDVIIGGTSTGNYIFAYVPNL